MTRAYFPEAKTNPVKIRSKNNSRIFIYRLQKLFYADQYNKNIHRCKYSNKKTARILLTSNIYFGYFAASLRISRSFLLQLRLKYVIFIKNGAGNVHKKNSRKLY